MTSKLVPAAARALATFEVFAREKRELSNIEIAKALELPESSCSDLVNTLMDVGYLSRSPITRKLYPTGRLFAIASEIDSNDVLTARLSRACDELRNRTGESALCGSLRKQVLTVVAFSAGRQALRYTSARGARLSLHVSASAKAILAQLPDDAAMKEIGTQAYEKVASGTVTDPADLLAQVRRIRKTGFAYLENEGSDGLASMAIAGPINGQLMGFGIAGASPVMRAKRDGFLQTLHQVCDPLFDRP